MNKIKFTAIISSIILAAGQLVYLPSGIEKSYAIDEEDVCSPELQYVFDDDKGTCSLDYNYTYYDDVYIPDTVEHNGKEYPVTNVSVYSIAYASSLYLGANVDLISGQVDSFPYLKMITVSPDNKLFTVKDGVLLGKCKSYNGEYTSYIAIYPTCKEDKEYTIPADIDSLPILNSNPYLEKLTISEGVEQGLYYYFNNCTNLKSIYFPDTICEVGDNALDGCSSLTDIYYGGSIKKWNVISKLNSDGLTIHTENEKESGDLKYLIRSDGTCRVSGYNDTIPKDLIIPQKVNIDGNEYTVTEIDVSAFSDCSVIQTVDIPETVEIIQQQAFQNCKKLINIVTHNSIKAIGVGAFRDCSSLEDFRFDYTTEVIGSYAFAGCSSIKTVNIPAATEMIGNFSFYNCDSLEGINVDPRNKFFSSSDGEVYGKSGSIITAVRDSNMDSESDPDTFRSVMPSEIPGDVDRDGQVDINDLLSISMYLLRDIKLDGTEKRFADCNGDGCVDVCDLAYMKQYIMKDKVKLKKGPAVPGESCSKMLELVKSKTADGSPLDVGYQAAGYERMFGENHNVSIFDGGYSCSLKESNKYGVRKEGYYDEYSIVREISDESTEEDIDNYQRIIDYIDNEAGKDNYYLYDVYKKESYNLFYPWSYLPSEWNSDENGSGEAVSDNSYFVEIVIKNDGEEYKNPDAYKDDYVVTYQIVNKSIKSFTGRKSLESVETQSELISEYPYHILSYPKVMAIARKYNLEQNGNYPYGENIGNTEVYRYYDSDIVYADTSFTRVDCWRYGMIRPYYIFCNTENDYTAKNLKINVHIKSGDGSEQIKSEIDNLVSYFEKNGVKIIISDDIDFSESDNNEYKLDLENGLFYLKKGMWTFD